MWKGITVGIRRCIFWTMNTKSVDGILSIFNEIVMFISVAFNADAHTKLWDSDKYLYGVDLEKLGMQESNY